MKALLIDDDVNVRMFIKHLLKHRFKWEILEAGNGLDALSVLQNNPPDIIFLDIAMPEMDGSEFLETVRADSTFNHIPVLVMSAFKEKEMIDKMVNLGITDYLVKPLSLKEIEKRIINLAKTNRIDLGDFLDNEVKENDKKKVLLVEPDERFITMFNVLYEKRFQILIAKSGAEGLNLFVKNRPDYIVVGSKLETVSEVLFAKKIKDYDKAKRAKIYLLCEGEITDRELELLYHGFLRKNVSAEVFNSIFTKIVLD